MAFWGKKDEKKPEGQQSTTSHANAVQQVLPVGDPVKSTAMTETLALPDQYGKVRSALGPGTVIQGRLSFDTVVSIDGKLGGEIFSSKALLVGQSGVVDAQIEAQVLIVKGIVRGTIKATERIEIRGSGQIIGDVTTPVLVMDPGCIFQGSCTMPQVKSESVTKTTVANKDSFEKSDKVTSQLTADVEQMAIV